MRYFQFSTISVLVSTVYPDAWYCRFAMSVLQEDLKVVKDIKVAEYKELSKKPSNEDLLQFLTNLKLRARGEWTVLYILVFI